MAIVKAVGGGKSLYGVLRYVTREDKTLEDLIGGWNVDPQNAYEEMTATKKQWGKTDGRAYKHFVQSFHADDTITPEEAHAIAGEFVARAAMFRDYEVLYATHTDRGHVHTHIVVNSVNIRTGEKFRYAKPALEELKRISDEIVQAHGYRLEHERGETENVTAWDQDLYQTVNDAQQGKRSSWMYDASVAVQEAMDRADDLDEFIEEMKSRGYSVRWGERSITYTTPDRHRVRASRLEEIFRLSSVREKYAERETEQEQLREDLHKKRRKPKSERPPENEEKRETDYSAFDVDMNDADRHDFTQEDEIEDFLYEAACAICRQLRTARSADEFYRGMRQGGFRVQYDKAMRDYVIHTPNGDEIYAKLLESYYGLPSIREAVIQLHRRPAGSRPVWDGHIWPEYADGFTAESWDDLLHGEYTERPGYRFGFGAFQGEKQDADSRYARLHLYIYPDSPMWDYELQAAALVLGQGICNPNELEALLKEHGYALRTNGRVTYLLTPRGRRIVIDDHPPQPIPYKGPFHRGIIAVVAGEYMRYLCDRPMPRRRRDDPTALVELTLAAILGAAALIELIARLVAFGIHVIRRKHSEKVIYEAVMEKASMTLNEAFERAGVQPEFAEKIPAAEEPKYQQEPEETEASEEPVHNETPAINDKMEELLGIVQRAAVAADRETFEELLKEQGCTTRWTKNGTLTFILDDGTRIRASRLEKTFNLPSIVAAYGQERRVPQRGARYEAAQFIQRFMRPGCSRHEFKCSMEAGGYRIEWRNDGRDATIIAPDGQRMRLSSLTRTFSLDIISEMLGENRRGQPAKQSTEILTSRKILQDRIAAAQEELRIHQQAHIPYRRDVFER